MILSSCLQSLKTMAVKIGKVGCARGCVDKTPAFMEERQRVIEVLDSVYKKHNSEKLETPAFELKEVYSNKRNKFDKILDLNDQGGEILSMRFDLKSSLTRYLAMLKIEKHMRISQFGNVYRKETLDNKDFRPREFFVSDFDICGPSDAMLSESQCIRVAFDIVDALKVSEPIVLRIGHRRLTECFFRLAANVNESQAVKLVAKLADENRRSLINWDNAESVIREKKITTEMISEFRKSIESYGGDLTTTISRLQSNEALNALKEFKPIVEDMEKLNNYCKSLLSEHNYKRITLDFSLVGPRSYYTGLTFAMWLSADDKNILSGGRYDNLIARINPKSKFKTSCTGFSVGIDQFVMHTFTKKGLVDVLAATEIATNDNEVADEDSLCQQMGDVDVTTSASAPISEDDNILKNVKGTLDRGPQQMVIRERVFKTIEAVFKRHGAGTIDTPVMEQKAVLTGKYGEDSKLIYDLNEVDGERISLRYDLTVPFARYLAMHPDVVAEGRAFSRYQIGKVYRRDKPSISSGRYREFYQCDFDIAGEGTKPMQQDALCLEVAYDVLMDMNLGEFTIKVNHRKFLDGLFEVCGVPSSMFRTICSSVDKLDKTPWSTVQEEMIKKGLDAKAAARIGEYVCLRGRLDLVDRLEGDAALMASASVREALADMRLLLKQCGRAMGALSFDLSLARGLDYYTGMIMEAVIGGFESRVQPEAGEGGGQEEAISVGSVSGGGRYDNLVNMFSEGGARIPCVGLSIGVERLMAIHDARSSSPSSGDLVARRSSPQQVVMVMAAQKNMVEERLRLLAVLLDGGVAAVQSMKADPKALDLFQECEKAGVPWAVIVGEDEIRDGCVKLREVATRAETMVPRGQVIDRLLALIG